LGLPLNLGKLISADLLRISKGKSLPDTVAPLSTNMKAAIGLLYVFVVAIIGAFAFTLAHVSFKVQLLAIGSVVPIIALAFLFIYFCRKQKIWSFAGASVLGTFGVILRVLISTQPNLEVGGGLPVGVTALYIVLGSLVALKSYECVLELRK